MIAQTIKKFAQNGGVYVGSAGNRAQQHYRANLFAIDGPELPTVAWPGVHNYAPGVDIGNTIVVPQGCSLSVTLQWNNPWGAANDDFDLFIARSSDLVILAQSLDYQTGTQNPIESTGWTNSERWCGGRVYRRE